MPAPKRIHLAALLFAFLLALPAALQAQDVFVRPNSGSSNAPTVDYGVKARPAPAQAPAVPAPAPVQPAPAAPAPQPAPAAPVAATPMPEPVPASNSGSVSVQNVGNNVTVFKVPEDPPPSRGTGSNNFSVSFQPGLIGVQDKSLVMNSLGISEQELQANCFFRYSTLLSLGNGGGSYIQSGAAPSAQQQFNGQLSHVNIYPSVACRKVRQPISGMIMEQGSYYVTSLNAVECNPGNKAAGSIALTFRYTGDGTGQCSYQ